MGSEVAFRGLAPWYGTHCNLPGGLPAFGLVRQITGGHEQAEQQAAVLLVLGVISHCGQSVGQGLGWGAQNRAPKPPSHHM